MKRSTKMKHEEMEQFALPLPEGEQLKKFGAWCKAQCPGKKYSYWSPPLCAIGQWYKSMGYVYTNPYGHGLLEYFARIKPHTYGALADRIQYASSIDFACARHYG